MTTQPSPLSSQNFITVRHSFIFTAVFIIFSQSCTTIKRIGLINRYFNATANSSAVDTTVTDVVSRQDDTGREATILSAFYGLDDDLPRVANKGIGKGAGKADGMPVIFSHEVDPSTLQPGDFRITTASGHTGQASWVTLAPADDKGEFRTVLFAGNYGSILDQPVKVEVIGNVLSLDGKLNFKGSNIAVTPLQDGATMVWAEIVPKEEWAVWKPSTVLPWGNGSGAAEGTKRVVRVTWSGGVTKVGGKEIDDAERILYRVTVLEADGSKSEVIPFAIADLGDGDNNHELCLDVIGTPISVFFPAGHLKDPRGDLNPQSVIRITQPK